MDPTYPRRSSGLGAFLANCLTAVVLVATVLAAAGLAAVFVNPSLVERINPFLPIQFEPAPTVPPTLGFPTITHTPNITLPPTWTPTPTDTPTPSITPTPTPEPTSTETPTVAPSGTPAPSPTGVPFAVQPGSNILVTNFANDLGCNWMGIAGQVFDLSKAPYPGVTIHVEGQLAGQLYKVDMVSGTATRNIGPAGYVFDLSDHPIASTGTLWIQLKDTAGLVLSEKVTINTSDVCDKNMVFINWNQVR